MNVNSEIIHLHDALARLCKLYIALEEDHNNSSDAQDLISELKNEIENIYSEIISMANDKSAEH
jgi:hypothetical protein